jgi:phosphoribosyl 1,2-cyclic phosphate phosphodiesterase
MVGGEDGFGYWGACNPANTKNRRSRASIAIETATTRVLIDTSPDLREQLLHNGIKRVDAILYTHEHADHLHGIDDIRSLNYALQDAIPCYATKATWDGIKKRFDYIFTPLKPDSGFYKPSIKAHTISGRRAFTVGDMTIQPFIQKHGWVDTLGFRIGGMAYSTDVKKLPKAAMKHLQGLDLWVVDCLQFKEHPTHADYALTMSWIEALQPKRVILTHMNTEMDYDALDAMTPAHITPAYDGMVINL